MTVLVANNARSTLAADIIASDTTISVQTGDAAKFPSPGADEWFPVTLVKADGSFEILHCTGRVGAVLTVTRAQESTTALAFATGDRVDLRLTAATIAQIQADAAAAAVPVGASMGFNRTTAPDGWLKENGAAVSRTVYADLYAVIGTTFGAGDGSTTFNLPDSRGEFHRGLDDGRGVDTGRTLGSSQAASLESHTHTASAASGGVHTHGGTAASGGAHTHSATAASSGAHTHTGTAASAGSHGHTGTAASAGSHSHTVDGVTTASGPGGSNSLYGSSYVANYSAPTSSAGAHTHSLSIDSGGAHTHSVSVDSGGSHTHTVSVDSGGAHTHTLTIEDAAAHTHTITVDSTGDAETRSRNVAKLYCIKY